jgi:hypothetical protein
MSVRVYEDLTDTEREILSWATSDSKMLWQKYERQLGRLGMNLEEIEFHLTEAVESD